MLGELLRKGREDKGYKSLELARLTMIDGALISKFESGQRKPTLHQLQLLAQLFELDFPSLHVLWIQEKIIAEFGTEPNLLKAISAILTENQHEIPSSNEPKIHSILEEMERLKDKLQQLK